MNNLRGYLGDRCGSRLTNVTEINAFLLRIIDLYKKHPDFVRDLISEACASVTAKMKQFSEEKFQCWQLTYLKDSLDSINNANQLTCDRNHVWELLTATDAFLPVSMTQHGDQQYIPVHIVDYLTGPSIATFLCGMDAISGHTEVLFLVRADRLKLLDVDNPTLTAYNAARTGTDPDVISWYIAERNR